MVLYLFLCNFSLRFCHTSPQQGDPICSSRLLRYCELLRLLIYALNKRLKHIFYVSHSVRPHETTFLVLVFVSSTAFSSNQRQNILVRKVKFLIYFEYRTIARQLDSPRSATNFQYIL